MVQGMTNDPEPTGPRRVSGQLQLPLDQLAESARPVQFRLDLRTRQRGLAHIAEIRRQAAQRRAVRQQAAQAA